MAEAHWADLVGAHPDREGNLLSRQQTFGTMHVSLRLSSDTIYRATASQLPSFRFGHTYKASVDRTPHYVTSRAGCLQVLPNIRPDFEEIIAT